MSDTYAEVAHHFQESKTFGQFLGTGFKFALIAVVAIDTLEAGPSLAAGGLRLARLAKSLGVRGWRHVAAEAAWLRPLIRAALPTRGDVAESSRAQAQRLAEDVRTITSVVRRAVSTDPRTREAAWTEFEARAGYANAKLSASLSGKFDPVTYVGAN